MGFNGGALGSSVGYRFLLASWYEFSALQDNDQTSAITPMQKQIKYSL